MDTLNYYIKPVINKNGILEIHFPGDVTFESEEEYNIFLKECIDRNIDIIAYSTLNFEQLNKQKNES